MIDVNKLHGHPSTFKGGKGKTIAAIVYGDNDDDDVEQYAKPAHLTSAQYHKLVQLVQESSNKNGITNATGSTSQNA